MGKKIVLTGTLTNYTRDEMREILEERKKKSEKRNELYYSAFSEGSLYNKPKGKNKSNLKCVDIKRKIVVK